MNLRNRFKGEHSQRIAVLMAFGLILILLNFYMLQEDDRNEEDQNYIEQHIIGSQPLIDSIAEYYAEHEVFPSSIDALEIDFAYSPKIFEEIALNNDRGEIMLRFAQGRLRAKELFIRPVLAADGSIYRWHCHSDKGRRIKQRQLPFICSPSHPLNRLLQEWDKNKESSEINRSLINF